MERKCLNCNEKLDGRIDKKFCGSYCKTAYHYEKNKEWEAQSLYKRIDRQLKLNRRILKDHNRVGKTTIRKTDLRSLGFDESYFTHYWKNAKGQVYLFCYEYGFLSIKDNGKEKYLLVTWQDYMGSMA